ncbi:immunoglobulin domain-containing protein [Candidatus Methanocrinis natronophilus]|uniref:Immunoglobulin domain-containing protein n=1 Tax=Candidatus Methanocrinis natronophilus TaxID=3033396 RepID=A0ABT5XA30_9EURY|nr:immunoglobulin domain-containing protein [Candidatus Methanocrinis natronophilus]MDF0591508.1 immunoglobulin domain-containing protein [Candidatus Methanocrinis natronophilus]
MKEIKLLMAVLVIGILSVSSSLGGNDEAASTFEMDWFVWPEDFDFGEGFDLGGGLSWEDAGTILTPSPGEASLDQTAAYASSDEPSIDPSGWQIPVDGWIIDEGFYSDEGGSEGEEPGWSETDDHPWMPGPEENALWIVFPYSTNVRTTKLLIQKDRFAKELLIPGMDGKVTIYEERPDGTVSSYVPGWQVKANRAYRAWFTADSPGDYTVWYEVYNSKNDLTTTSNAIRYRVFENLAVVVLNEAKCPGETATLRAIASGCDPIKYEWFKGDSSGTGTKIANATESVYIIRNVSNEDAGYYTCKVTCNQESDEDRGRFFVGWWECDGISPCICKFRPA